MDLDLSSIRTRLQEAGLPGNIQLSLHGAELTIRRSWILDLDETDTEDTVVDAIMDRSSAASAMGRSRSVAKQEAARLNGKKGGRPRKQPVVS